MGEMGWREVCRKCGGEAGVEMTLAGEALSACGFCGFLERWSEPDGQVQGRGGNGCATMVLRDTKTVSPGMGMRALTEAWRRMGTGSVARRLSAGLEVMVVTRRGEGSKWWSVSVRKERSLAGVWHGRLKEARVVAALMVCGHWSEDLRERMVQRRVASHGFAGQLRAGLARSRLRRRVMATVAEPVVEADEDWDDVGL